MVSFCVFAKSHHRRFVSLPPRDLRGRRLLSTSPSPKSFPAISFADPHPLTPATSIFYKNRAGRGHVVRPLRPLDATLSHPLVCVANKELTQYLSALDATLTKNMGVGRLNRSTISFWILRAGSRASPFPLGCLHLQRVLSLRILKFCPRSLPEQSPAKFAFPSAVL